MAAKAQAKPTKKRRPLAANLGDVVIDVAPVIEGPDVKVQGHKAGTTTAVTLFRPKAEKDNFAIDRIIFQAGADQSNPTHWVLTTPYMVLETESAVRGSIRGAKKNELIKLITQG